MTITVLLADDQALIRAGFAALIASEGDLAVVGEAEDGAQAVILADQLRPDVVLMDIRMPGTDGLSATETITSNRALDGVRVLVLTTFESDDYVLSALRAGASGFLGKGVEPRDLLAAIRTVAAGDSLLSPVATGALIARYLSQPEPGRPGTVSSELDVLTEREREIVALVAQGLSNDDIAARLFLSPLTAKTHVNRAMTKLGARDRAQLVVIAYQSGLVRVSPGSVGRPDAGATS
jgi:DNA-binding NarL/FixJ family response regulator